MWLHAKLASKFSAYGVTHEDDPQNPINQAMKGLIDATSAQDRQIALLWQAIEKLQANPQSADCVPADAARNECFEAEKMSQLVGK